jgi:hypothetical protein
MDRWTAEVFAKMLVRFGNFPCSIGFFHNGKVGRDWDFTFMVQPRGNCCELCGVHSANPPLIKYLERKSYSKLECSRAARTEESAGVHHRCLTSWVAAISEPTGMTDLRGSTSDREPRLNYFGGLFLSCIFGWR